MTIARSPGDERADAAGWPWSHRKDFLERLAAQGVAQQFKTEAADLKVRLQLFGVSCFVALEDIEAETEWQNEIEVALASMHGFVAILTKGFHESNWTDQEVGFAFARRVPRVAVRLGTDPYGFMGKFQGLSGKPWKDCPLNIIKRIIKTTAC